MRSGRWRFPAPAPIRSPVTMRGRPPSSSRPAPPACRRVWCSPIGNSERSPVMTPVVSGAVISRSPNTVRPSSPTSASPRSCPGICSSAPPLTSSTGGGRRRCSISSRGNGFARSGRSPRRSRCCFVIPTSTIAISAALTCSWPVPRRHRRRSSRRPAAVSTPAIRSAGRRPSPAVWAPAPIPPARRGDPPHRRSASCRYGPRGPG